MSSNHVDKNQSRRIVTDLTKFKAGATRTSMTTNAEKSIFDQLDINLDGRIDSNEEKRRIKAKYNGKEYIFIEAQTLPNGQKILIDAAGKKYVQKTDGSVVNINKNYVAEQNAGIFYQIADNNSGLTSIRKMQKFLDTQINADNIMDFLDKYDKAKKGDSSIIDTVTSEIGASGSKEQKKVLDTIMQKLSDAAKKAGVSISDINRANTDFQKAYYVEYGSSGAFRKTNPKDMEKAMDFLRGAIKAKQAGGTMSDSEAIKQFKGLAANEHNTAARNYNTARSEEGWAAKAGDTICGWFGCTTRDDMYKKFGNNKILVDALLNAKTEDEFKRIYQFGTVLSNGEKVRGFGIRFDASKIAARQNALGNYQHAVALDSTIKMAEDALKYANGNYSRLFVQVRNNFGFKNDAELRSIIDSYALAAGKKGELSQADKKELLIKFLNDTKANAAAELKNTSKGKSLEQMENDLNLITRSAFGTSDIVKDQIQFNENQMITGMITEAGAEIAGTIALQFIPGLGQMAAAKLAASSAKWGVRAVKVTKALQGVEKGFAAIHKVQTGAVASKNASTAARTVAKAAQVGSQMVSAGVATAAVDISNLKSKSFDLTTEEGRKKYEEAKKEVGKKILMNMSFAGVGASSSILAERMAATFGIESSLAREIAEEVMNATGSYGVSKAAGMEYGSTDAFVDLASGLIIARISHVKGDKDISLSEIDRHSRVEELNQANLDPWNLDLVRNKKAQQQVSNYLDHLLEAIPDDLPEVSISSVNAYDDFILPDGTVISRNFAGDTGELVFDELKQKNVVSEVDNAVLFWIKDVNGVEHVLPALTPENVAKAKKLLAYMSTQEAIPRRQIGEVQAQFLGKNFDTPATPKADATATPPAPKTDTPAPKTNNPQDNVSSPNAQQWRKVKIGDEEIEVPITKNADGSDNVDFTHGRKLNASGEYEYFDITTNDDIMSNGPSSQGAVRENSPPDTDMPAQTNNKQNNTVSSETNTEASANSHVERNNKSNVDNQAQNIIGTEDFKKAKQEIRDMLKLQNLSDSDKHRLIGPINEDNVFIAKQILADPELNVTRASYALSSSCKDNLKYVEQLYYNKNITDGNMKSLLYNLNNSNSFILDFYLQDNNFINKIESLPTNKHQIEVAKSIINEGKYTAPEISQLLDGVNIYNKDVALDIINKYDNVEDATKLLKNTKWNSYNCGLAPEIISQLEIPIDEKINLINSINYSNKSYARDIIFECGFSPDEATKRLKCSGSIFGEELANVIVYDKDFSADDVMRILSNVGFKNKDKILNAYNNRKELGLLPNQIKVISESSDITIEQLQYANKKFGTDITKNFDTNDFQLLNNFSKYNDINSISELSKPERRELLMDLLKNKNAIYNNHLKEFIPILPTNGNEYEQIIKSVTQSMSLDFQPLNTVQQQQFDNTLKNLSASIKDMDLSGLHKIELSMSQDEFMSDIKDIIKNLPPSEQAKVQDFFGFRIEDGKLTGYPNANAKDLTALGINDKASMGAIERMRPIVEKYSNNNFITTNEIPELNQYLKDISKHMPELFNQIDGSANPVDMIKSMQKVVQNPKFAALPESDQKVMMLATLLQNTDKASGSAFESAFDAYFIAKKFNISDKDAQKVYKIVQTSDTIDQFMATKRQNTSRMFSRKEREELVDFIAFNLKEDNTFDMAQMLYSTKGNDGLTRYLDKNIQKRITKMKSQDFILPQTSRETYHQHATKQTIERDGVSYEVEVVNSEDIDNFYAFIHTPEAGYTTGGSREANFANFEIFKDFADDKVICTSYVTNGKAALVDEFHYGFIFDVSNEHQYVAGNRDIYSEGKDISSMLNEYYTDQGLVALGSSGAKYEKRTMVSDSLKSNLTGQDYVSISKNFESKKATITQNYQSKIQDLESKRKLIIQEKFGNNTLTRTQYEELNNLPEIQQINDEILTLQKSQVSEIENIPEYRQLMEIDDEYIKRLDKIKKQLGDERMTVEKLEEIDPEFAQAYKQLLNAPENRNGVYLMNGYSHNEALVSNPEITALYTDDITTIPVEYLQKAQDEGLPIVIIKTK